MLHRAHLLSALAERRNDFLDFERLQRDELGHAVERLRALGGMTAAAVRAAAGGSTTSVTTPSDELDSIRNVVISFAEKWRVHDEARAWARDVLEGRVTFAADGSQVFPGRDVSMPVAAVQIASFENSHRLGGDYRKEISLHVITPNELMEGDRVFESPDQVVALRRFELEAKAICEFLETQRGWRKNSERVPVAFFDNTLLISSRRKDTEVFFSKRYVSALAELIQLSRETEVPVVGYVDQSYAPDMRDLLEAVYSDLPRTNIYDTQMLSAFGASLFRGWGDRTVFWYCRRPNLAAQFFDERGEPLIGFVYLQTTGEGHAARLEIPVWVYEAGLLNEVVETVRAECVVGNGYPYAIETADDAAVMSARDRQQFLRIMQDFADRNSLAFTVSRKSASKARRR